MGEHANETALRAGYAAFSSGDFDKLNEFIPEDAVWHVLGNSSLSGDYNGRDAIYGYFGKLMETTGGTFKAELVDVLANDERAVAIQRSTATVDGKETSTTDVLVDRFVDGVGVETWVYFENDQILES
jgi:ketosteroid isomerase-like protein